MTRASMVAALALATVPPVPWLATRPAHAPGSPPLAPACRARDLRASLELQGATGSLVGGVALRNVGARPCSLLGWPTVSFTRGNWRVKKLGASTVSPDVLADPPGPLRALRPAKSASVELFWSNWCGAPPGGLLLHLAGGTTLSVSLHGAPRCDAPHLPSTVSVGPYVPAERPLPESSRLPLRVAIVGTEPVRIKPGLRAFRVHRGERFTYAVSITNAGKTTFRFARASCPTYIEQLDADAGEPYVLNCRPVAAIAPTRSVVFAMQIAIPPTARLGTNSLTWQLAPKTYEAPFAPAALWVEP